ncbi:Tetratricopeptide-like helical domain containing protein [Parasponia andersonii]|uniref:Tetratricopeptide-like helical domain containing protein n=1 Tax=Parasponia andersonii TaxID=3476 RepID=A0A2P5D8B1_PARAD|nr:Tetratricopeptide-like helical domain containing protein [Parasponia andersonii]
MAAKRISPIPFSILFTKLYLCLPPPPPNYTHIRTLFCSSSASSSSFLKHQATELLQPLTPHNLMLTRLLSSSEAPIPNKKINTKVNFSLSDSDDDDEDDRNDSGTKPSEAIDKSKLPPPYDPFNKKPVIEEPDDPRDLQEVFHKMRTDGLLNNAVKMFDGLSKDGLTHEALELFSQIKDKGNMPDVVAHTAVVEAYANAGQTKEALKVFLRMLAAGVAPNAYTYSVLVKGLAADPKFLGDAKKYVMEMMAKGMKPNAGTYAAVFEAFAREEKEEEAREFLEQMRDRGFVPDEKAVREVLSSKRGPVFRSVIHILFGK